MSSDLYTPRKNKSAQNYLHWQSPLVKSKYGKRVRTSERFRRDSFCSVFPDKSSHARNGSQRDGHRRRMDRNRTPPTIKTMVEGSGTAAVTEPVPSDWPK